jgi:alkanesulfonate monooxygenase SsuD/methylene tetrahydromethanopterin reductase-like flavin-dependent oxidoreductase (luciferase family)
MIKRIHVLYVGQIELENIGLQGAPANDRRYSNERLTEVFWTARDVAQLMDELGYYALWTAEHHFQHEGYECLPNLIQLSLWLATQTRRLKLGCAFNVLPMWHPIRIAEDYAMADIVTDGRVIMGVGRGYHSREVESFGAPVIDQLANRALFEEQVDLMLKCFNDESFSHHGKAYQVPPPVEYRGYQMREITCVPRPKYLPVEIWMPIASSKSIDYMASKNFKAMVTLNGEKILDDVVKAYRDAVQAFATLRLDYERVIARHGGAWTPDHLVFHASSLLSAAQAVARTRYAHAADPRYQAAGWRWFWRQERSHSARNHRGRGRPQGESAGQDHVYARGSLSRPPWTSAHHH